MGQVIGPDGRGVFPGVQVHHDVHLPGGHVDQCAVLADTPGTAHLNAVDADVQGDRIKRGSGGAHGREDTAPVRVAAERISIAMSWLAPSASAMSCRARSAQTEVTATPSSVAEGVMPDAPDDISRTVSLVDMQPSESIRSKVISVAPRSAASRAPASATASVVITTSIVASAGASMPAPFAIPPTDHPSPVASACLSTVSVVMIAVAAACPPVSDSAATAASIPVMILSMGNSSPIRPVEATTTSPGDTPSAVARCSALRWVSANPAAPVQALAPPELSTTASTRPSAIT